MKFPLDKHSFIIKTLGCKVNQYESQAMREALMRAGFRERMSSDIADIYIVNTCTVTHHADRESRHLVGSLHKKNPKAKIVVTGCYIERDSKVISSLPGVTHLLKNEDKPHIVNAIVSSGQRRWRFKDSPPPILNISDFRNRTKAFIKIQDGCENRCSYCKVSLVRGPTRSRPLKDIVEEAERLFERGFKEIVLVGICLGAWGRDLKDTLNLTRVLSALRNLKGDFRIRLSSIEPKYVTDELIDCIASDKMICRHLHIPLQSGDDEILRSMNRPYTSREFRSLIDKIKRVIPEVAITTDVMVGFPGESEESFKNTLGLVKDILPLRVHIFSYSPREGTAAYRLQGLPDERRAKIWYSILKTASFTTSYIYRRGFLNKELEVLVETKRDKESAMLTGYTDTYMRVLFEGPDSLMKRLVPIKISYLTLDKSIGVYGPE